MLHNVWAITATCGRNTLLRRSVACFLAQDYEGEHNLLIFNNSDVPQTLMLQEPLPPNKHVHLINQHIDFGTGKPYANLGAIYNDALAYIPPSCTIITHSDDDDLFLPNHISEGVKGYIRSNEVGEFKPNYLAYKPEQSWFRHAGGVEKMGNTLEPSIFVSAQHMKEWGYRLSTTDQHLQWFDPLLYGNKIYIDPKGPSTLIYNWGDTFPTFKTSGNAGHPFNFENYRAFSHDHADQLIIPIQRAELQRYYNQIPT